jgi:hypothetical protein
LVERYEMAGDRWRWLAIAVITIVLSALTVSHVRYQNP